MVQGSVYRRCGCRDQETGKLLGTGCPGLQLPGHGSWYFSADLPSAGGKRRRVRRGGFASRRAAASALEALSSPAAAPALGLSTGEWLHRWLESRVSLRPATVRSYTALATDYLVPYLGKVPLAALTAADVQGMFTAVIRDGGVLGRPVSGATVQRIHAVLRAGLNGAVRAGLIPVNPGRFLELPRAPRVRPQVWTPALTERWQRTGWRPVVGVWTPAQTGAFLAGVRDHRLYALFHLVALRGLRRGEAAGLTWDSLDLDAGSLAVSSQLQQLGGQMLTAEPKSEASRRTVALDATTVAALRRHRARQDAERAAAGSRWAETGYVFRTAAGRPVGPDRLSRLFRALVAESGLPPVTLHGLRHGAATLALAAGADLKVVQDQLGHSTITLTADTYTSVLPETARAAAESTASLLFPAARRIARSRSVARRERRQPVPGWVRRARRTAAALGS